MRAATAVYRRGGVAPQAYRGTVDQFWSVMGRDSGGRQMLTTPASLAGAAPQSKAARGTPTPRPGPAPDLASKLADLGKLRTDGVLTEAEFAAAKKKLLGG